MTTEFAFRFDELDIDQSRIISVLGYEEGEFPEPFPDYLEQALQDCMQLTDIRGAYVVSSEVRRGKDRKSVFADGVEFRVGRTVFNELKGVEKLAFFVCTAGITISEKAVSMLKGDKPVLGYVYDVLGSAIAEAAGDRLQEVISWEAGKEGGKTTNRYSPGYCNWDVADQYKLFSLFGHFPCGVTLTSSALMKPVKSISGLIGIGSKVHYREYQCSRCRFKNCVYRK